MYVTRTSELTLTITGEAHLWEKQNEKMPRSLTTVAYPSVKLDTTIHLLLRQSDTYVSRTDMCIGNLFPHHMRRKLSQYLRGHSRPIYTKPEGVTFVIGSQSCFNSRIIYLHSVIVQIPSALVVASLDSSVP